MKFDLYYFLDRWQVEINASVSAESSIIADIVHGSMTIIYKKVKSRGKPVMYAPGIDVESMVPLTETNCVTSYRTKTPTALFSLPLFAAASRNISLSVRAIIDSRCTNARLTLRGMAE